MKNSIDFIGGDTRRSLLRMVGPLLAAMVLTMAYNLVDSLWVGNLMGETGYAALTSSTSVVLILSAIAMGSSNGAAILIAQTAGAKREAGGLISVSLALAGGVFRGRDRRSGAGAPSAALRHEYAAGAVLHGV